MPIPKKVPEKNVRFIGGPYHNRTMLIPGLVTDLIKYDPQGEEPWRYVIEGNEARCAGKLVATDPE